MVERRAVERHLYDRGEEDGTAAMMAEEAIAHAAPGEPIDDAIARMLAADLTVLPVVSAEGRLEGLLVLKDVRRVPDLVETVDVHQREHAEAAEAGATRVLTACSLVSAALGMVLLALWIEGPGYGLPVGCRGSMGSPRSSRSSPRWPCHRGEMFSVPLWAVAGVGLCFAARPRAQPARRGLDDVGSARVGARLLRDDDRHRVGRAATAAGAAHRARRTSRRTVTTGW